MKKNISLNLLKFLTMLLIINSHSDALYPEELSFLASGGGIGNELFFLISGYLFSAKEDIRQDIKRRFARLYVPAYIMIAVTFIFGRIQVDGLTEAIRVFIWPTQFWFVGAIFLYSILIYWLIKHGIERKKAFLIFTIILIALDLTLYLLAITDKTKWIVEDAYIAFIPFRSIYSIFSFVLGYYLMRNGELLHRISERKAIYLAVLLFIGFYGFKLLLNKGIVPMPLQIISQPLTVLSAVFIFSAFVKVDMNPRLDGTKLGEWINRLSSLSLESYLVQFLIIDGVKMLQMQFPVSLLLCFIIVFISAGILKKVSNELIMTSSRGLIK